MKRKSSFNSKKPKAKRQKTSQVTSLTRRVNRVERDIEHKFYEVGSSASMATTTVNGANLGYYQQSLVDMASGDTVNTRTANQIKVKKVSIKGVVTTHPQQVLPTTVKVYVVLDKQCNGATSLCPYNGPYGVYSDFGGVVDVVDSLPNLNTTKTRYKILKEKTFIINPLIILDYDGSTGTTSTVVPVSRNFQIDLKMNQLIQYHLATAGNSAILSNNISVGVMTSIDGGVGPAPKLSILSRSEFTDA